VARKARSARCKRREEERVTYVVVAATRKEEERGKSGRKAGREKVSTPLAQEVTSFLRLLSPI
jgi:hypothetical protein